jgi:hypothetical protein
MKMILEGKISWVTTLRPMTQTTLVILKFKGKNNLAYGEQGLFFQLCY